MIRIRNISDDYLDECVYEVGINNHPAITTFKHRRTDGLAVCLFKASKAIEHSETGQAVRVIQEMQRP